MKINVLLRFDCKNSCSFAILEKCIKMPMLPPVGALLLIDNIRGAEFPVKSIFFSEHRKEFGVVLKETQVEDKKKLEEFTENWSKLNGWTVIKKELFEEFNTKEV